MAVLIVIAILLILLLQLRCGVILSYGEEGPNAVLRIGPARIQAYPGKPQETKGRKKPKKKPKKKPETEKKPLSGGSLDLFLQILPVIRDFLTRFSHALRVDELTLHLTWASSDPADAAVAYGNANAAIAGLLPVLEQFLIIRHKEISVAVDFTREKPVIFVRVAISMRLAQLLGLALRGGIGFLQVYWKQKRHKKRKKAVHSYGQAKSNQ